MPVIREAGFKPRELDELVTAGRWRQWCHAEPDLAAFGSLKKIRSLRSEAEDKALGALLRLAAKDGGDDQLAAVAVLHQLGGSVRTISRNYWFAADGEAEGVVAGAMWEQIRTYDWRAHTRHHASAIHHATRKSVRAALLPDDSRWQSRGVMLLDPQSRLFEAVMDRADPDVEEGHGLDAADQLEILVSWSVRQGVLDVDDAELLEALVDADRQNPGIKRWKRGVCSVAAVERAASERGVCAKTVTRARDRAIAKLRRATPTFWEEVA